MAAAGRLSLQQEPFNPGATLELESDFYNSSANSARVPVGHCFYVCQQGFQAGGRLLILCFGNSGKQGEAIMALRQITICGHLK